MLEEVKENLSVYMLEKKLVNILFYLNITQFLIIVALIIGIFSLFPLKQNVPFLVQFSSAEQNFTTIREANNKILNDESVRIGLVSSYVQMRETKNNIDDQKRYESVRTQSSVSVWRDFEIIFKQKEGIYQKKEDYSREIKIVNIAFIPGTNIAQVDFQAIVRREGKSIDVSNFRAVLNFKYADNINIKFDEISHNPIGFIVSSYSLSKISTWTAGEQL